LIASVLDEKQLSALAKFAKTIGLEVLVEVHSREEIYDCLTDVDLVGVNNRNLQTFETSIDTSLELFSYLPGQVVKISESGIEDPETVIRLREVGYQGFLIGGSFMKETRPEKACMRFIKKLKSFEA